MKAIDVQQVDRAVVEPMHGLVERAPDQGGEGPVPRIVVDTQSIEHAVVVRPRMVVPFPGIDGEGPAIDTVIADRLTQGEIREAGVRTELDDDRRAKRAYEPEPVWGVLEPRRGSAQEVGLPEGRLVEEIAEERATPP